MHLFQLPPEIFNMIIHLCKGRYKSLRRVNTIFKSFIDPLFFKKFKIFLRSPLYNRSLAQIQALADRTTEACAYARDLEIVSLSPRYMYDPHRLLRLWANAHNTGHEKDNATINALIPRAIESFTNLRSVDWTLRTVDDDVVTEAVMAHFGRMTTLRVFTLRVLPGVSLPKNVIYLQELKALTVLATPNGNGTTLRDFVHRLATVIGNCPKLEYLTVDFNEGNNKKFPVLYLSWLLKRLDASAALPLKEVKGRYIAFDPTSEDVLPHLQNLRSLSLVQDADREEVDVLGGDENTPYVANPSHTPKWKALERSKICLETLKVDEVTDGLINYLASYDGLKSFQLVNTHTIRKKPIAKWVKSFYKDVLPRHADTLEHLTIEPEFQTGWCFNESTEMYDAISQCKYLRSLALTWNPEKDEEVGYSSLYSLLDLAGEFDHLETFSIRIALPLTLRTSVYSTMEDYLQGFNRKLMVIVPAFDRVNTAKHPERISVGKMNFGMQDKQNGKGFRYCLGFSGFSPQSGYWRD